MSLFNKWEMIFPQPLLYQNGVSAPPRNTNGADLPEYHGLAVPISNAFENAFNVLLAPPRIYTQESINIGFRDGVAHFAGAGPIGEHFDGVPAFGEH